MNVAKKNLLKQLKKTLLLTKTINKEDKQANPIKLIKRLTQPVQRKVMVNLLYQTTTRKIQLQIMLSKNAMYLQKKDQLFEQDTKAFCV
jgi:hypothetical protein